MHIVDRLMTKEWFNYDHIIIYMFFGVSKATYITEVKSAITRLVQKQ